MYPFVGSLNTFCVISPIPDVKHNILAMDMFFIEPNWPMKRIFPHQYVCTYFNIARGMTYGP